MIRSDAREGSRSGGSHSRRLAICNDSLTRLVPEATSEAITNIAKAERGCDGRLQFRESLHDFGQAIERDANVETFLV